MKTSLNRFQICLWAQFIFIYRTSDQAFKQKPLDQKIMIKNKKNWLCMPKILSMNLMPHSPVFWSKVLFVLRSPLTWWRRASRCYQSEILCLKWHCAVWPQGSRRSGPVTTSLLSEEGGGGASAPARWPLGTSRALCLTKRKAFVKPAGDGLWFIHSFSRISLSSCVLLS